MFDNSCHLLVNSYEKHIAYAFIELIRNMTDKNDIKEVDDEHTK